LKIDQMPVKAYNEELQPVDLIVIYTKWMHRQDQSYLGIVQNAVKDHPMYSEELYKKMKEDGMSEEDMVKRMDGMKKKPIQTNVHSQTSWSVVKNSKKESVMKLADLQKFLEAKGIVLNADGEDFEVEETPVTDPAPVSGLSAEEVTALKGLASLAPRLNAQALEKLDKIDGALDMATVFASQQKAERETLIASIKMNAANPYSDEDLAGMSTPVLVKMNGQMNVNFSALGGGSTFLNNDDVLVVPSVIMAAIEKEK